MLRSELTRVLGPDLVQLLAGLPVGARRVTEITRTGGDGCERASFRVELDDGRVVKARRLRAAASAGDAPELTRLLDPARFVRVLAWRDRYRLEEWVEGVPLDEHPAPDAYLEEAADVLAGLHAIRELDGRALPRTRSTAGALAEAERDLHELRSAGILAAHEVARLSALARECSPGRAAVGVTHNDFCGENLVVDASGRLRVVDNEALAIGFLGYDLGRSWYRWDLDAAGWGHFLARYRLRLGSAPSPRSLGFWCIAATVRGARVRAVKLRSPHAASPLRRLRELLAARGSSAGRGGLHAAAGR